MCPLSSEPEVSRFIRLFRLFVLHLKILRDLVSDDVLWRNAANPQRNWNLQMFCLFI